MKIRLLNYNELSTLKQVKKNLYEAYDRNSSIKDLIEIAQDTTMLIEASCDKTGKIEAMTDELEEIIKEVIAALSKNDKVNSEDKEALTSLIIAKEQLKTINKPLEHYCNHNEGSKHKYCNYAECIYKEVK